MLVKDYDTYFEKYMGRVFFRIIKTHKIKEVKTVVEFAPGFRYKIAYALKRMKFEGALYIIDSNKNVLNFVEKRYKRILPKANIIIVNKSLKDSIKYLPLNIDLFLTNHSIDDMIIAEHLNKEKLKKAFDNDEYSKDILIKTWNELSADKNKLIGMSKKILCEFDEFFTKINVNFIIMSQYKSGYYMGEENYVEALTEDIFLSLKNKIQTDSALLDKAMDFDFKNFQVALLSETHSLKNNIQNGKNWIAGKYGN